MKASDNAALYQESNWWLAHEHGRQPHETLIGYVQMMRQQQATRYDNFRKLQNIYEWGYRASAYLTNDVGSRYTQTSDVPLDEELLTYNAASNVIDTVHAKVTKTRIVPMPITTGGNYMQRVNAKKLGQAIDGEFDENKMDEVSSDVVKEGLIMGTGWAKVFSEWGRIRVEAVPAEDITVDDGEGRYRKPRCIYHRQLIDRFVLKEIYGVKDGDLSGTKDERVKAILMAPSVETRGDYAAGHDQVEVVEAYHLPSRPVDDGEETDGRHSICIQGCTLMDKPWTRQTFPFARYVPVERRRSIWGLSLMHKLSSSEREFEKVTQKVQVAFNRMAGSHIMAPRDADIDIRDMGNQLGTFFEYTGNIPPQPFNPPSVSDQTLGYKQSLPDDMMRFAGVSPLSAQQQIPAGLSHASGKALQVYEDFESERLISYHRALESFVVEVAQLIIDEARAMVEEDPAYSVRFKGNKTLESVKWKDVLMAEDDFILSLPPTSQLAKQPAAKFEQLQELLNAGVITIDQFRREFQMPDLQAENELDTADVDIVDKMHYQIAYDGKEIQPQPFDNLDMAIARTRKFINLMRTEKDVDDAVFDRLHDFMFALEDLKKAAMPPPAPPMPPQMGGPPPGGPMPPPMDEPMPPMPNMPPMAA